MNRYTRFKPVVALLLILALTLIGASPALAATVPANNNFKKATAASTLPFNDTTNNASATLEASEPQGCSGVQHTIWYKFTATKNTAITASIPSFGFFD